jgi:crotonobetainyl-CoA:carnitine CoA-transferase CaiB-like acyl-CoA transferase
MAEHGRDDLLGAMRQEDIPAGPVNTVSEALAAMESAHGGRWLQAAEGIRLAPDPIRIDGERLPLSNPPPRLGEQTDEVLLEAGLTREEIAELRNRGVVA